MDLVSIEQQLRGHEWNHYTPIHEYGVLGCYDKWGTVGYDINKEDKNSGIEEGAM